MRGAKLVIAMLGIAVVTLAGLNVMLLRKVVDSGQAAPSIRVEVQELPDAPVHRVYLVFSPAQCSSGFVADLESWPALFERFHGSAVWLEAIAVHTSEGELGRFWEAVGFKLPVRLDPDGSVLRTLGIRRIPAKVVVQKGGDVVYREEFPDVYPNEQLADVLERLEAPAIGAAEGRSP